MRKSADKEKITIFKLEKTKMLPLSSRGVWGKALVAVPLNKITFFAAYILENTFFLILANDLDGSLILTFSLSV